jgi:hypothetical protein
MTPSDPEAMQHELVALLEEAQLRELSPEEFSTRLGTIHALHLADDLNSIENVQARRQALSAYEQLIGDIDQHHQIECMAAALGVQL